jgi:EmrB/QacA subfamily drug resistance transporter
MAKRAGNRGSFSPEVLRVLSSLALGMFLAALDQTVMSTAGATIASYFGQLSGQAWLLTSYLLASLITTPIYGRLSDGYGRRPLFITALSVFIVGSIIAAIAPTFGLLVVGRMVQGLGAGGLFSLAFAVISDLVPPRERSRYILVFVVVFGSSSLFGPLVGGVIATQNSILGIVGWRWIFILNIPIALYAIFRAARSLHVKQELHRDRFDWWGVALFSIFVLTLLLLSQNLKSQAMHQWKMYLLLLLLISFIMFLLVERAQGDTALIPLHFFTNRLFTVTLIASMVSGAAMLIGLVVVPLSVQVVQGETPAIAGLILLTMGFGNLFGSGLASRSVAKTGQYRWLATSGLIAFAIGFAILFMSPGLPAVISAVSVMGFGSGLVTQFGSVVAPHALGARHRGSGSAINTFARQFGGVLGSGLSLATIFQLWKTRGDISASSVTNAGASLRNLGRAARDNFITSAKPVYLATALALLLVASLTRLIPDEKFEHSETTPL